MGSSDQHELNLFEIRSIRSSAVNPSFPTISTTRVLVSRSGSEELLDPASPATLVDTLEGQINTKEISGACLGNPFTLQQVLSFGTEMNRMTHPVCLAIKARLDDSGDAPTVAPAPSSGIKLVQWVQPDGHITSLTQILRLYSKAGIWNHIVIPEKANTSLTESLLKLAISSPNIVHSWQVQGHDSPSSFGAERQIGPLGISPPQITPPRITLPRITPLPGRPFWQGLPDPIHLLPYLDKYGLKQVMRWRWLDSKHQVVTLGQNLSYHFVAPKQLSSTRLDEICQLIESGGSVAKKWVRYNLERAFLIAYVTEMDVIVANSSLKHPRPEYIEALSEQAGMDLSAFLERGYTSVRPEYRGMGIGTKLLAGLTSRIGDRMLFSLISEDNLATQKIAQRNHTRKITTFFSRRTDKQMGVWVPESMLDRL